MAFSVEHHGLLRDGGQVPFQQSPNHGGELIAPEFLILHFTAGTSFDSACNWLTSKQAKASAHLVIGRKGELAQLAPFNVRAWHAGQSQWGTEKHADGPPTVKYRNLNQHSIGIELVNAGPLNKHGDGTWRTLRGAVIKDEDVVTAMHKNTAAPWHGWQAYTAMQIETLLEVGHAILNAYPSIKYVLGHDDIAPGRKWDVGPAFAMHSVQSELLGRADE